MGGVLQVYIKLHPEVSMELYRVPILLEKSQREALTRIAQEEGRSLSEIVREMIDGELQYRHAAR